MKSILVGLLNDSRVYYNAEAKPGEKDAIIEKPDGTTIKGYIMSISTTARDFRKLRSTPFQRFLWDAPKDPTSGAWYETFIEKTRPIKDSMLDKMPAKKSVGKNKKKIDKTERAVKSFIDRDIEQKMLTSSCCDEMIKLDVNIYKFKTLEERDFAWKAMLLLRELEENNSVN
jgi:hypothetical protein